MADAMRATGEATSDAGAAARAQQVQKALMTALHQLPEHLDERREHLHRHQARRRRELDEAVARQRAASGAAGVRAHANSVRASTSLPKHTAMTPWLCGFALPAPLPLNAHHVRAHYGSDRLSRLRPALTASAGCTAQSGSLQLLWLWPALPPRLNGFVSALIPLVSRLSIACLSLDLACFLLIS